MYGSLSPASGESMLTGSPASPSSAGIIGGMGSPKNPFLPAYLFGHQSTPAENHQRSYQNYQNQQNSPMQVAAAGHHHVTWSPDLIQRIPPGAANSSHISRFGGPPIRSLDLSDAMGTNHRKEQTMMNPIPLERLDSSYQSISNAGNISAAQIDPFYTQGEDFNPANDMDESWVTVFGFPPDAAGYILKEFSAYGTIVEHEFASKGNWVHMHFQSAMQAKKALAKNGHLYAQNTIRIGVSPCIDKDVIRRHRRKNLLTDPEDAAAGSAKRLKPSTSPSRISINKATDGGGVPVTSLLFTQTSTPIRSTQLSNISSRFDTSVQNGSPTMADPNRSSRLGTMRSLTAAYEHQQRAAPTQTGQEATTVTNGGLMTKAWKYIFSQ